MRRRAFGLCPVPASRYGHSASIPHAFASVALRASLALQGKALRAIPAARCLAPLDTTEPAEPDRPGQRPAAPAGLGEYAEACCRRLCKCVPPSTLPVRCLSVTKDGSRMCRLALSWRSTSRFRQGRRRGKGACCRKSLGVDHCLCQVFAAETVVRGCRAGHVSFRGWVGPRRPCVVVNPGGGAGFMAATLQTK